MAELWKQLHIRALGNHINDQAFIAEFTRKIPRYTTGCRCKEFWTNWIRGNRPTYGDEYFEWTVKAHNAVNRKLGKPILTVEEARQLYII